MSSAKPAYPHDDEQPDSLPDEAESGAITRGDGDDIDPLDIAGGATVTHFGDLTHSTDGSSDHQTTTGTGRTTDETSLLGSRLAHPHIGHEKYVAAHELGRGGMGVVRRVLDIDLRRDVAMKVMLPDARESKYARFIEEAQVTGQLEHPNIVPVHDLGLDDAGCPYFTMKLVDGRPLSELLERQRRGEEEAIDGWPLGRLLGALIGICNGIAYAHEHGVVHRDLKPANIMLGSFGESQVMDWGLAKIGAVRHANKRVQSLRDDLIRKVTHRQRKEGTDEIMLTPPPAAETTPDDDPFETRMGDRTSGTLTHDGSVMGTPVYMPPEQARGAINEIDERSDVYSLGAILYEILTLRPPVSGASARRILERVKSGAIIAPERRTPKRHIPQELSAIAMKALATDPAGRYQRVDELRRDIERFVEGKSVSAKEDSPWEAFVKLVKRNKPVSMAVGIAMLVLTLTVTLAFSAVLNYWSAAEQSRDNARQAQVVAERSRDEARKALADFKREQALRAEAERRQQDLTSQIQEESRRGWHPVHYQRFGRGCFEHWRATAGWEDRPALLDAADRREWISFRPDGLHVAHQREVLHLVYEQPLGESVRVQYAATVDRADNGGIHLTLRSDRWNRGYIFQVGGWKNTRAAILRGTGINSRVLTEASFSLVPGQRHVMEVTMHKHKGSVQLTLRVDDRQLLTAVDKDPLSGTGNGDCALWLPAPASATLHWARIWELGAPLKEDLLATADRHLGKGNYQTAFDLYQEVAESGTDRDQERITQAELGMERARELLAAADKLTKWRGDLKRVWHDQPWSLDINESSLVCTVSGKRISHINPLRSLPLDRLTLYQTRVGDLRILRGMPLRSLTVAGGRVRDLQPLAELDLQSLTITGNLIENLEPLALLPLNHLDLSDSKRITDLQALTIMHELEVLIINNCSGISSLAPLRDLTLDHLEIAGCTGLDDLQDLAGLDLRSIVIDRQQCEHMLTVLGGLEELERIVVRGDSERPTGYRPDEFWQRYGLGAIIDLRDESDPYLPKREDANGDANAPPFVLDQEQGPEQAPETPTENEAP